MKWLYLERIMAIQLNLKHAIPQYYTHGTEKFYQKKKIQTIFANIVSNILVLQWRTMHSIGAM